MSTIALLSSADIFYNNTVSTLGKNRIKDKEYDVWLASLAQQGTNDATGIKSSWALSASA